MQGQQGGKPGGPGGQSMQPMRDWRNNQQAGLMALNQSPQAQPIPQRID